MNIYIRLYITLLTLLSLPVYQALSKDNNHVKGSSEQVSEQEKLTNFIFSENIKTVKLHPEGWDLGYPVIDIRENIPRHTSVGLPLRFHGSCYQRLQVFQEYIKGLYSLYPENT